MPEAEYNQGDRETYKAMVESMDRGIGRIVATVEENGLSENTLIIFASDNGANNKGRNAPLSGYKGGLFEGGIRVPGIVRFDGRIKAATVCEQPCMTMDLSRSIVRLAGVRPAAERPFDGMDIVDHVANERAPVDRNLFWRARRGERTWKAVRSGNLKYIGRQDEDRMTEYLFDLAADAAEKHNLLESRPREVRRLQDLLAVWEAHVRHHR
jgi:N-acetylgalactosamine-6-sulfatase